MQLLTYHSFYLVGIKGVAMTALAQCLLDAGKEVKGSDVFEEFVTEKILRRRQVQIDFSFETKLPAECDCVIYTAAHQGVDNPQVVQAQARSLPIFSHAQALGELFNQKKGVAVCGVGGKSTTSAMVTWILEKTGAQPSFAVGVGNIPGLDKTGKWLETSEHFVAEADEYAANPSGITRGETLIPRFAYLEPLVTICTNLQFDHPDVYRDFEHTQATYLTFFNQLKPAGELVINGDDPVLVSLTQRLQTQRPDLKITSFGRSTTAQAYLQKYESAAGKTISTFTFGGQTYTLELQIPGQFNVLNALAAILACRTMGVSITEACRVLKEFRSTMRRVEFVGEKNGVKYYDDYAHHPHEVKQVIKAFREWFPDTKLVVAFQSHTYSRTKSFFPEFISAFGEANEVVMIPIFPSAREAFDPSVTSQMLCQGIEKEFPLIKAQTFDSINDLVRYLKQTLKPGSVCLTVGAGDIYHLHEQL